MKLVINSSFGGFSLSPACAAKLGTDTHPLWDGDEIRTNPELIKLVEEDSYAASGECASLMVVNVPDKATDYMITEYDGSESVIYVLDGKMHYA